MSEPVPSKATVLHDLHISLGAKMAPFGGFMMPIQYEGIISEHHATRRGATLFDTCHMGEFLVSGPTACPDIEGLVTCPVSSIRPGHCRYGLLCNEKGGVIDDLLVYRLAEASFMIVVNASTQDNDFDWIGAHLSPTTKAVNVSATTAKIDLQGPASPRIAAKLLKNSIAELTFYSFMENIYAGKRVLVSRTGYTGEIGFEVYLDNDLAAQFWRDCMALDAKPAGLGARDTLRLEMGMPLYGHELSEGRNASESGFTRAIAKDKTFIGSPTVLNPALQKDLLVGISLEGRRAARNGEEIVSAAGETVGAITSGSFAPSLERAVAMGYVRRDLSRPGTQLAVRTARQELPGTVSETPFYKGATGRKPMGNFLND